MNVREIYEKETESCFATEQVKLGPWTSDSMCNDPKHLAFVLARYKFVAKMLAGKDKKVLEIGCGDSFGLPIVAQEVQHIYAIDWEEKFIKDNEERLAFIDNVTYIQNDINEKPVPDIKVDAIYNIDFIEHLDPKNESAVMEHMLASFARKENAVMIIGTPNLSAAAYASPQSAALHINLKSFETLKQLLSTYFENVFMFGMNDEMLHTGYAPMCHYLFGMGVGLKEKFSES